MSERQPTCFISCHGRLETHLEEQHHRTEFGEPGQRGIVGEGAEPAHAGEVEIAEQDTAEQLTQDRGLTQALGEVPAELGGDEDRR